MRRRIHKHVRPIAVHGCSPLQVGLGAVGHGAIAHHLVLGVHGVVHHHALVPLLVLQMAEVLFRASVCYFAAHSVVHCTYPVVAEVLVRVLRGRIARLTGHVDVPKLDPPVEQERIVCDHARGQLGQRQVLDLVDRVDAVGPVAGAALLGQHLQVAVEHGARQVEVLVTEKVVVDVRVELFGGVGAHALGMRHVAHDGRVIDGAVVRIHGRHVRQLLLLALHRDGTRRACGLGAGGRVGVSDGCAVVVMDAMCRAPQCWSEPLHQHGTSPPRVSVSGRGRRAKDVR